MIRFQRSGHEGRPWDDLREDGRDAALERMAEAWARLSELADVDLVDPSDRAAVAATLWDLSSSAYETSIAARRDGRHT